MKPNLKAVLLLVMAMSAAAAGAQETRQTLPSNDNLWALDRIDQRFLPFDRYYDFWTFVPDVNIYVVDSGITGSHAEFEGRTSTVYSYYQDAYFDDENNDCDGHGTTVAGVIAGKTYGAAKGATIKLVRVTGCTSYQTAVTPTAITAALRWLRTNAQRPAVVNISLGVSPNADVDREVRNLVAAGITVVVSAGNNYGADASTKSPARVAEAITVAASTKNDERSVATNIGPLVDFYAPGDFVMTTGRCLQYDCQDPRDLTIGEDCLPPPPCHTTAVLSGTSFAAGYVTGVVAQILQKNPQYTPAQVREVLIWDASPAIKNPGLNTTNLLLRVREPATPPDKPLF